MMDKNLDEQFNGLLPDAEPEEEGQPVERSEPHSVDATGGSENPRLEDAVAGLFDIEEDDEELEDGPWQEDVPLDPAQEPSEEPDETSSDRFWQFLLESRRPLAFGLAGAGVVLIGLVVLFFPGARAILSAQGGWFKAFFIVVYVAAIATVGGQWLLNVRAVQALFQERKAHEGEAEQIQRLEKEVEELTATNARLQQLRLQLQIAGQVTGDLISVTDPDSLLTKMVRTIEARFGLYHVDLFLVDPSGEWAVLEAGTGEPGRQMLEQGYRVEVGGETRIGEAITENEPRFASDVGEGAVRFDNALLPRIRSELILPLRSRGQVIGAVVLYSDRSQAFGVEDESTLQTMADELGGMIAITQRLSRVETRLEEVESQQRRRVREQWGRFVAEQAAPLYERSHAGTRRVEAVDRNPGLKELQRLVERAVKQRKTVVLSEGDGATKSAVVAPLRLRGQTIGAIGLEQKDGQRQWTDEEIGLIESIADQMALAIENARLLEDTQRRAAREQTLSEMGARFTRSLDIDTVLQTAVRELGQLPNVAEVSVHVAPPDEDDASSEPLPGVDRAD